MWDRRHGQPACHDLPQGGTFLRRQMCTAHGRQTPTMASISRLSQSPWWLPATSQRCTRQDAAVAARNHAREWRWRTAGGGPIPEEPCVSLAVAVAAGGRLAFGLAGTSSTGLRSKKPSGRSLKPTVSTGMMGQSSVRGKWVSPKVCQTTMSWPSMSRSWAM